MASQKPSLHLPPDPEIGDTSSLGVPGQLPALPVDQGGPAVALQEQDQPLDQAEAHPKLPSVGAPDLVERRRLSPPPSGEATEIKPPTPRALEQTWGEWLSKLTIIVFVGALAGFALGVILAVLILSGEISMKSGVFKAAIDWVRALR